MPNTVVPPALPRAKPRRSPPALALLGALCIAFSASCVGAELQNPGPQRPSGDDAGGRGPADTREQDSDERGDAQSRSDTRSAEDGDGREVANDSGNADDAARDATTADDPVTEDADAGPAPMPVCGNGAVEGDEACDDGAANSDSLPDACRTDCTVARCGDGVVDTGEECDDGNDDPLDTCDNFCASRGEVPCSPCDSDEGCGGSADRCVELPGGQYCARLCESSDDCPDGFECIMPSSGGTRQCLPEAGTCEACFDPDGDGYGIGSECAGDDCDRNDPDTHPGAAEMCDDKDNDCDGEVDEGLELTAYWTDADGDGFGDASAEPIERCSAPEGAATQGGDCDDSDPDIHPDAEEVCDGSDNDCDDEIDEGFAFTDYWPDADGDGFGDAEAEARSECFAPPRWVDNADDCDDGSRAVFPGGEEVCDTRDNDCDGEIDEGIEVATYWPDADGDGFGDATATPLETACPPPGHVVNDDDCNDSRRSIRPGATESCDGKDQNCDGVIDDGADCGCAIDHRGGNAYLFCSGEVSWTSARDDCRDLGYELVTIDDADENRWVTDRATGTIGLCSDTCTYAEDRDCDDGGPDSDYSFCSLGTDCSDCGGRPATSSDRRLWIGLNDRDSEGTFRWSSGSSSSYRNWRSGEPNESWLGEDCTELRLDGGGWNDSSCGSSRGFVCEAAE